MANLFRQVGTLATGVGRRQARPKVFCIGFHKTGTSSLDSALTRLGYRVTGPNGYEDPDIGEKLHELAAQLIDEYDAFQDNPWPLLYRWVDERVPGARFILTIRDEDAWLRSVIKHFGERVTPMRELIYGEGHGSPVGNEDLYLERYRRHNREVLDYFRGRDDLLVLKLTEGEGWERLCPFLGHSVPRAPFPHANRAEARSAPRGRIRRIVDRLAASLR
jgi:hypothetical protein